MKYVVEVQVFDPEFRRPGNWHKFTVEADSEEAAIDLAVHECLTTTDGPVIDAVVRNG